MMMKKLISGQARSAGTPSSVKTVRPGQNRARTMDEPVSNYPGSDVRSILQEPQDFVIATGGAYFFMPSISAMRNDLSG